MSLQGVPTEEDIRREVKKVIAMVTESKPEEIPDTAYFWEDLHIDSLSAMEIMVGVEKKYKILFPEKEFAKVRTVNDAVEMARRCVEHKPK